VSVLPIKTTISITNPIDDDPNSNTQNGLDNGTIVGVVVGCLALVVVAVGIAYYFFISKKKIEPTIDNQIEEATDAV
jgi:hypothetical protein